MKYTSIVLLALCAVQVAVALPAGLRDDPSAQEEALDVVASAQESLSAKAAFVASELNECLFHATEDLIGDVEAVHSAVVWADLGYYDAIAEDSAQALEALPQDAEAGLAKLNAIVSQATADLEPELTAAAASIDQLLGDQAEPLKTLLATVQDTYAQASQAATASYTAAMQNALDLSIAAVTGFPRTGEYWYFFGDYIDQVQAISDASGDGIKDGVEGVDEVAVNAIIAFYNSTISA